MSEPFDLWPEIRLYRRKISAALRLLVMLDTRGGLGVETHERIRAVIEVLRMRKFGTVVRREKKDYAELVKKHRGHV